MRISGNSRWQGTDGYALDRRVLGMVWRVTMNSLGFWAYLFGVFVVTAIAIPVLIIAFLLMIPTRALVAVKRTLS